jgi:ATP synthase protein I
VNRPEEEKGRPEEQPEFAAAIRRKCERRIRARDKSENLWFWLGMMGLVGWSVAIPTVIGVAIGVWIDSRTAGSISWTLTFLFIGVVIGCLQAWFWVKRESGQ